MPYYSIMSEFQGNLQALESNEYHVMLRYFLLSSAGKLPLDKGKVQKYSPYPAPEAIFSLTLREIIEWDTHL